MNKIFREWREKFDQIDDPELDTLEFTEKKTFIFNQELSGSLTGDEIITLPHALILVYIKNTFFLFIKVTKLVCIFYYYYYFIISNDGQGT